MRQPLTLGALLRKSKSTRSGRSGGGSMPRRAVLLSLLALSACGFELRKEPELHFSSVGLSGFSHHSAMEAELRRQLSRTTVQVLDDASRAQVVIEAERDERDKVVVVPTSAGQVREWELRLHLDYVLRRPDGEVLLPRTEMTITREMTFTETQALAKEQEEAQLYRAMQSDAVHQVLRRLSVLKVD